MLALGPFVTFEYWPAVIRRRGYPSTSETFNRKTDAEKWARGIEAKIEAGKFRDESQARRHTVGELIDRYIAEIIPIRGTVRVRRNYSTPLRLSQPVMVFRMAW